MEKYIASLPDETALCILQFFDFIDICILRMVSKTMCSVVDKSQIFAMYKQLSGDLAATEKMSENRSKITGLTKFIYGPISQFLGQLFGLPRIFVYACFRGNYKALSYSIRAAECNEPLLFKGIVSACTGGHLVVAKNLFNKWKKIQKNTLNNTDPELITLYRSAFHPTFMAGHVDVMKWLETIRISHLTVAVSSSQILLDEIYTTHTLLSDMTRSDMIYNADAVFFVTDLLRKEHQKLDNNEPNKKHLLLIRKRMYVLATVCIFHNDLETAKKIRDMYGNFITLTNVIEKDEIAEARGLRSLAVSYASMHGNIGAINWIYEYFFTMCDVCPEQLQKDYRTMCRAACKSNHPQIIDWIEKRTTLKSLFHKQVGLSEVIDYTVAYCLWYACIIPSEGVGEADLTLAKRIYAAYEDTTPSVFLRLEQRDLLVSSSVFISTVTGTIYGSKPIITNTCAQGFLNSVRWQLEQFKDSLNTDDPIMRECLLHLPAECIINCLVHGPHINVAEYLFEVWLSECEELYTESYLSVMGKYGCLDGIMWLLSKKMVHMGNIENYCLYWNLATLYRINESSANITKIRIDDGRGTPVYANLDKKAEDRWSVMELACLYGHLPLVKYLCGKIQHPSNDELIVSSCIGGNIDIIRWFLNNLKYEITPKRMFYLCATHGHIRAAKYIYHRYPESKTDIINTITTVSASDDYGMPALMNYVLANFNQSNSLFCFIQFMLDEIPAETRSSFMDLLDRTIANFLSPTSPGSYPDIWERSIMFSLGTIETILHYSPRSSSCIPLIPLSNC